MKKVGIISLNINTIDLNLGAVAHSYAFNKYLNSSKKVDSEIINYIPKKIEKTNLNFPTLSYIKRLKLKSAIKSFLNIYSYNKKKSKIKKFVSQNMNVSDMQYNQSSLSGAKLNYDVLVCESDIIWSLNFSVNNHFDEAFFLNLPSMKNIKKIAYSPSLGDINFTSQNIDDFKNLIKGFYAISCREAYAVNFVQKLTILNVEHVLDPVFLLSISEYKEIMSKRLIKEDYVLIYFAGKYDKHSWSIAKNYAKKHNLKLVEISKIVYHCLLNKTFNSCGVEEFLSLIYYANVVFSDSFHCTSFSIIFNKNFYVLKREGQGKKILDLCQLLNLDSRFCSSINDVKNTNIDYLEVNKKLKPFIDKSKAFIEKNIIN